MKFAFNLIIIFPFVGFVSLSSANTERPDDFIDVNLILPNIVMDIRYATANNFVGTPITGYRSAKCLLQKDAAEALVNVYTSLAAQGLNLKVFDCYRPQRAVSHFMRWVQDTSDTRTKNEYYPNLDKHQLVGGYIAEQSGHSRGATIDLTLVALDEQGEWQELDMGGPFDLFDPLSNTEHSKLSEHAHFNRQLLKQEMAKYGFADYDMEWWHFSYQPQPYPETYFDFPVE